MSSLFRLMDLERLRLFDIIRKHGNGYKPDAIVSEYNATADDGRKIDIGHVRLFSKKIGVKPARKPGSGRPKGSTNGGKMAIRYGELCSEVQKIAGIVGQIASKLGIDNPGKPVNRVAAYEANGTLAGV